MKLTPLVASRFVADGGVMFGIVPRPLWTRLVAPDENNGIPQHLNTWLVELDDGRRGLLDLGCGNPAWFPPKARAIHGLQGEWPLAHALAGLGVNREDIHFVLLTHLHWDHAGGVGRLQDGVADLTFPNAVHVVHAVEYYDATTGNVLLHKAYPEDVWAPLTHMDSHHRRLVDRDNEEVFPGVRFIRTGGHTNGHALILFEHASIDIAHPRVGALGTVQRAIYAADLCPTRHHLRLAFAPAYDTFPLDTRRWKHRWLPDIAARDTLLLFDHDPDVCAARITPDARQEYVLRDSLETLHDAC